MKPSRKFTPIIAAVLLAACGGGGGGGGTSDETGKLASFSEGSVPDHMDGANVGEYVATNRGLYLRYADNVRGNRIFKLHGDPKVPANWSAIDYFPTLVSYAPTNVYSEKEGEISFYWNLDENNPDFPGFRIWGHYSTEVSGEIDILEQDDISIDKVAAGGISGANTMRPWVIASGDGVADNINYLWQNNGQSGVFASDSFPQQAGTQQISDAILLSHPTQPRMFAGEANKVYVFSPTALERTIELPVSTSSISQLLWHDGSLWVGYDGKVYRIRDNSNTATEFTQVTSVGINPKEQPGSFCIHGGDILTADGQAKRISDGYKRSWLTKGELTSGQTFQLAELRAGIVQIYCSPHSSERVVFAPSWDGKSVRMIEALP